LTRSGFPDLVLGQSAILVLLLGAPKRASELAVELRQTKQALNHVLKDLEVRGCLRRTADPDDGRARLIELTPRGRRAAVVSIRVADRAERRWASVLGRAELEQVKHLLARLLESAE